MRGDKPFGHETATEKGLGCCMGLAADVIGLLSGLPLGLGLLGPEFVGYFRPTKIG